MTSSDEAITAVWASLRGAYLVSHDHGGASVDPQDGYQRLGGNKIQNLGDGFLVSAVPEHHAVDFSPGHEVAHMSDDAFGIRLVDQQGDHIDVDGVVLAPQSAYISVRNVARSPQDHCNVQDGHFLSRIRDAHQGKECWKSQEYQPGKPHSARLHSLSEIKQTKVVLNIALNCIQ